MKIPGERYFIDFKAPTETVSKWFRRIAFFVNGLSLINISSGFSFLNSFGM